jgi:hypothetical protein
MDGATKPDFSEEVKIECTAAANTQTARQSWETPKMEDVSEQVMAQPYIRFT